MKFFGLATVLLLCSSVCLAEETADQVAKKFWKACASGDIQQMEKQFAPKVTIRKGSEFLKERWGINPGGDQSKDLEVKREDLMKAYKKLIKRFGVENWQKALKSVPEE